MPKSFKIITLLDPEMCHHCNFCGFTELTHPNGTVTKHIKCLRFDCDNWIWNTAEPISEENLKDVES